MSLSFVAENRSCSFSLHGPEAGAEDRHPRAVVGTWGMSLGRTLAEIGRKNCGCLTRESVRTGHVVESRSFRMIHVVQLHHRRYDTARPLDGRKSRGGHQRVIAPACCTQRPGGVIDLG